jgi:hypothetical protein
MTNITHEKLLAGSGSAALLARSSAPWWALNRNLSPPSNEKLLGFPGPGSMRVQTSRKKIARLTLGERTKASAVVGVS